MRPAGGILFLPPLLLIGLVLFLYYSQPGLLQSFEAKSYDWRLRVWRGPIDQTGAFAIVAIDDKSIAELGRFPWTRRLYADLIERATEAGAKGLLFDVLFPEPEAKAADHAFAEAIARAGNITLVGAFEIAPDGSPSNFLQNIPQLQNAAGQIAHINIFPDDDGVLRWTRLTLPLDGRNIPSLAYAAALAAVDTTHFAAEEFSLKADNLRIPTDAGHALLINHRGPPGAFEHFSFVDVLFRRLPADALRDKVLFVGPTAIGLYDMRISPFSNNIPGIEINANIADNLLRGDFIERGGIETVIDLLAIVIGGLLAALIALRLRAALSFPLIALFTLAFAVFTCVQLSHGHWVNVVYPLLSIGLVYLTASYLRFFYLDRRSRQMRAMFSSYVSRKVVDELVKNPELAKVGGDSKFITILFADIKNYTSYSERRTPQEVVKTLNEYLAEMTHAIIDFDGTLDKFMGDGILAYWGAPLPQENHSELAARCALEMLRRLQLLHTKWAAEGTEPLCCGIGIHSGEVIAGNIGAEGKKMEYTVIGDAVNLTFRIQNESRQANAPVMTEALYQRIRNLVVVEPLGPVLVKGKDIPIDIFALKEIAA
ncbi:MAG: adenylate/guanylate cyclase domain-containing protein [Desulfuromonadales bacterium]